MKSAVDEPYYIVAVKAVRKKMLKQQTFSCSYNMVQNFTHE